MLDAEAIMKAYPEVNQVTETQAFKQDCVDITSTLEQSKIDAARVELNKLKYKLQRAEEYPDWGTQLDYIYHNVIDKWKTDIVDPVKNKYPKSE